MPHVKSNVGNPKLTYHIQCETITEDEGEAEGEEARRGALVIEDGCDCDCCCCCCKACTTRVACSLRAARIWTRSANVTLDFRTGRGPGRGPGKTTTTGEVVVVVVGVVVVVIVVLVAKNLNGGACCRRRVVVVAVVVLAVLAVVLVVVSVGDRWATVVVVLALQDAWRKVLVHPERSMIIVLLLF